MEDKKLFQIGEVAKMFQLSVGSLRHYEKADLLKPEYTDSETGYRYYSIRQFEVLNTIRYLRDLEYAIRRLEENQPQSLVFLGKVGVGISKENLRSGHFDQYDLVFLILDEEDTYHGKVEQHPEELCASICFCGSHNEADAYYRKLTDYINEHKMQITGASREITMIDNGITDDPEKFVTEILIPVKYEGTANIL